jgi:8-oxo-dGTP diphosphatase
VKKHSTYRNYSASVFASKKMPLSDQGINQERYTLIPRTLIFLTRGDKILLIKGSPSKRLWANLYNGIGGHIEPGEDILSAANREIYEETGLISNDLWLCATITIDTAQNPGIVLFVLRGYCQEGEFIPSEEGDLEWIQISLMSNLPMVEDLPILLSRILPLRKDEPVLSGHYSYDESGKMLIRFYDKFS